MKNMKPFFIMNSAEKSSNIIGQRLQSEMKKRGINSVKLAAESGVKTSFLYDIISGKSANPSTLKLAKVAQCLGISLSELVVNPASRNTSQAANDDTQSGVTIAALKLPNTKQREAMRFDKKIIDKLNNNNYSTLFWTEVTSDHMMPVLAPNDIVLINTNHQQPSPPGLFVISDNSGLAIKRVEQHPSKINTLHITCENNAYLSYEADASDCEICGRVVWLSRSL